MLEAHTKKDIESVSYDILKTSKSWGTFPTPVDTIVSYSELIIDKNVDVSQIHHGYLSRASDSLRSALSKIRGIFDRKERIIYLDLAQNDKKKNFVKLHECGHGVLPWQHAATEFLDDDKTLSEYHNEQFEAEANYFASATLFQLGRFDEEILKIEFGIKSAMSLAKKFGGSNHAAIRRYVECSMNRCSLLVLEDITRHPNIAKCSVRDYFQSTKFTKYFGTISWPEELGFTWSFVQDYYFSRKLTFSKEITINTSEGETEFLYDFFDTTYSAFVLIYPKGEKTSGKTKIIIQK